MEEDIIFLLIKTQNGKPTFFLIKKNSAKITFLHYKENLKSNPK